MTLFDGVYIHPESYGTVLVIGAWTFPLLLTLAPVPPATAAELGAAAAKQGAAATEPVATEPVTAAARPVAVEARRE